MPGCQSESTPFLCPSVLSIFPSIRYCLEDLGEKWPNPDDSVRRGINHLINDTYHQILSRLVKPIILLLKHGTLLSVIPEMLVDRETKIDGYCNKKENCQENYFKHF